MKFSESRKYMWGLSLLRKYQVISNLSKSGQSMCVMTSRHSCGENWKVNEAFRGIAVIKM